jgi:6-phosphogluconolactonase
MSSGARPRTVILPDPDAVAREAAGIITGELAAAIGERGRADLALTGGSTAGALYRVLTSPEYRDGLDWGRIHLWWGDERYVPTDHPDSNAGLAYDDLLAIGARSGESGEGASSTDVLAERAPGLPIPAANIHPIPVDLAIARGPHGAAWAADEYARQLQGALRAGAGGVPVFDVLLLGVGPDGHILSVFPESRALDPSGPLVRAVPAPTHIGPHVERITLAPRILDAARRILVMVTGDAKAEMLARLLDEAGEPSALPARLAIRDNATWLLDAAAARLIDASLAASSGSSGSAGSAGPASG